MFVAGTTDPFIRGARRAQPDLLEATLLVAGIDGELGKVGLIRFLGGPVAQANGVYKSRETWRGADPVAANLEEGHGTMSVGDSLFDVFFDIAAVRGTSSHGFALVGAGESGNLLLSGRLDVPVRGPVRITGTLRWIDTMGLAVDGPIDLALQPETAT